MGAVECPNHGLQIGGNPLCCKHVNTAVHASHASIPSKSFQLDFLDDGSLIYDVVICQPCIERYDIDPIKLLSGDKFDKQLEEGAFPEIAPACPECYANYKLVEHCLRLTRSQKDE